TLPKSEAPTFFEYFTDRKVAGRTETDPWGRPLLKWETGNWSQSAAISKCDLLAYGRKVPKWRENFVPAEPDVERCYLTPSRSDQEKGKYRVSSICLPTGVSYGTWKLKFRFPQGYNKAFPAGWAHFRYYFTYCSNFYRYSYWYLLAANGHTYFRPGGGVYGMDHQSQFAVGNGWYNLTIIRTRDNYFYTFIDDELQFVRRNKRQAEGRLRTWLRVVGYEASTVQIDGMEIYPDRYLFPAETVRYEEYVAGWRWSKDRFVPLKKRGITIRGRNVTLKDVSRMINDRAFFKYDKDSGKATCYTNLIVEGGSELVLDNETLKFHCQKDGELEFAVSYGGALRIKNSTVGTTGSHFFNWSFAGSSRFGFPLSLQHSPQMLNGLNYAGLVRLRMENSVIDNSAYFFIDSPNELVIRNTEFRNLHQIDTGEYSSPSGQAGSDKKFVKGKKSFCLFLKQIDAHELVLDGVKFKAGADPVDINFILNDEQGRLNIYDVRFDNANVVVRKGRSLGPFWDSKGKKVVKEYESSLGLVNCKFTNVKALTDKAWIVPKYYFDLKVVDTRGAPVGNAKVSVTNNTDDNRYPPESRKRFEVEMGKNVSVTMASYLPLRTTITGNDGHTYPPKERARTIILADCEQGKHGKKEFTYTVTVEKDGLKKTITGINPGPHWYRTNCNKPAYTIVCILGGKRKVVSEEELKKKGLAGGPSKKGER
ncbi:MAG: hypothetical protein KAV00_02835, partial [Phycisphaerae bacterium]|nr:hypothetical protein [Phycisphaerae bacterium]